jgi:hypothetical protein
LLVAMLRRTFDCRLPIEVWHIGAAEMGPPMRAMLESFDVRTIDALKVARLHPIETLGGWQLKTYALMHSDFQEILFLDADNMPTKDPAFLFEIPEYLETGVVFWPDIVRLKAGNPIWKVARLPVDTGASFETGQILLDKKRHWHGLILANWINQNHLAFEDMLYGDKDAFYVAWRMLGEAYHLIPNAPKLLDYTIGQRAPNGELLFQHRNNAKWLLNGPNPRIDGFRFEMECFELLAELGQMWDGSIFNPPDRSAVALEMERKFIASGRFRLIWVGSHEHVITLCPQHLVKGSATERYWFVGDGIDGLELRLVAGGVLSCALRCGAGDVWRGMAGDFTVELRPEFPDFTLGMKSAAACPSDELIAVTEKLLDCAGTLSAGESADIIITLATLAVLDAALPAYLENRAIGPSVAAALASAALTRYRSVSHAPSPPRAGTGWQATSRNLGFKAEVLPKR